MSHTQNLKELLRPLGVYDLEKPWNGGELSALGSGLDRVMERLDEIQREMNLATAGDWGIERMAALFPWRPIVRDKKRLAACLAALSRIGGDSFTLQAINDTISGCGVNAKVSETGTPGELGVIFPDVPGIPDHFEAIRSIIEGILPAHGKILYLFWYMTWAELEVKFSSWKELEREELSWNWLEKNVT